MSLFQHSNRPHIAIFSQTGSEILSLINHFNGKAPVIIAHSNKKLDINPNIKHLITDTLSPNPTVEEYERIFSRFNDPIITLHGFLRIIPSEICSRYRIYNLHPGLITVYPELKGLDPQKRVINSQVKYPDIGCVIHRVTAELDAGEIILSGRTTNTGKEADVYAGLKQVAFSCWVDFFNTYNHSNIKKTEIDAEKSEGTGAIYIVSKKYPETVAEFKRLQQSDFLLFCKKQLDYGPNNISVGTTLETEDDKRISQSAIIFRCFDKIQRLINLVIKNPKCIPANEPIEDSYQDISNFGIIARIVKNGKWAK